MGERKTSRVKTKREESLDVALGLLKQGLPFLPASHRLRGSDILLFARLFFGWLSPLVNLVKQLDCNAEVLPTSNGERFQMVHGFPSPVCFGLVVMKPGSKCCKIALKNPRRREDIQEWL